MKVKVFGFELHMGNGITNDDFFTHVSTLSGKPLDDRIIALHKKGDFWRGVLLSVKDAKAFCQIQRSGNAFTVTATELQKGANPVDFNFFVIHTATAKG